MIVIGYTRVSSEEQAREGVSLSAQAEKVGLYCGLHNLDLLDVVVDAGVSAKTLARPGLARVLAALDDGSVGGLVVFKLDRLTRSLGDWSALIDRYFGRTGGPSLMSVSESIDTRSAAGRMVLNMLMTVAQWERETIVERTRSAMAYKRSKGERISRRIPFGSDLAEDGKTLVDNPTERAVLLSIREWQGQGWGTRKIATELNTRGVPTKLGGAWSHSSVRAIVNRAS
jgi:site-specific DNA recombinase